MAFTGDLEHLHIVDIIQLLHTTRKSGIFSVQGSSGESRIVFRNGHIIDASPVDNRIHIEHVLVKMHALTVDDLNQARGVLKEAGKSGKPVLPTLIKIGKLKPDDALRALKQLVEITIIELMSWTKGAFTIDTDAIDGSSAESAPDQDLSVDAQMVLMDVLRIYDERERDRQSGKNVPSYEEVYSGVLPPDSVIEVPKSGEAKTVTADDLGLADIDRLEKKIPVPLAGMEVFDPVEIHRRKVKELLAGFSADEQEKFVAFLRKSLDQKAAPDVLIKQAGKAVVLLSGDKLLKHAIMSLCKHDGVLVFAADDEADLERILSQCQSSGRSPIVVFDSPLSGEGSPSVKQMVNLRNRIMGTYAALPVLQLAAAQDAAFVLRSYSDGVRAVFPKPVKESRKETFVADAIEFLDMFRAYIRGLQIGFEDANGKIKKLKDSVMSFRGLSNPSDASLVVLAAVSEVFERAITLLARPAELIGERAIGVSSEKSMGPAPADRLRISLSKPSVFRDVSEKGRTFYGTSDDEAVRQLFHAIGKPQSPTFVLLPLMSDRKVVAVIYGDFGNKPESRVQLDNLEILAAQAGIVLENVLLSRQLAKAGQRS